MRKTKPTTIMDLLLEDALGWGNDFRASRAQARAEFALARCWWRGRAARAAHATIGRSARGLAAIQGAALARTLRRIENAIRDGRAYDA